MRILITLALVGLLNGCLVETLSTTATQGETAVNAAESGIAAKQHTERTIGKAEIQQAIQAYHAENGSYPASLNALVPDYLAQLPRKPDGGSFAYDSRTGAVTN